MAAPAKTTTQNRSPVTSRAPGSPAGGASARGASAGGRRGLVGHTCAWKVDSHLGRQAFEDLKSFCATSPSLQATIRRKQLEIAVRKTSDATGRRLRLVRRDVVDATEEKASNLPVIGRVDSDYRLQRDQMRRRGAQVYQKLSRHYTAEQHTIHTTVVAGIVKRHVRDHLSGFTLRDHGGVYFVSSKLEGQLFALAEFMAGEDIGHITHFGVGGDDHETSVLSEEIQRNVEVQIEKIRDAFDEADLSKTRDRARLRKKVRKMRGELTEMEELFGFAKKTLKEKDEQVRSLMRDIIRGTRSIDGADLFSSGAEGDEDADDTSVPAASSKHTPSQSAPSGNKAAPSGDGAARSAAVPEIDYAA